MKNLFFESENLQDKIFEVSSVSFGDELVTLINKNYDKGLSKHELISELYGAIDYVERQDWRKTDIKMRDK